MSSEFDNWLVQIGAGKYAALFEQNEIDFDSVKELSEDDLRELGIPMGPRKKILRAIADLDGSDAVRRLHIAEALTYRRRDPADIGKAGSTNSAAERLVY